MIIGMLWFDNSKVDLSAKVNRAGDFYKNKYGRSPNACFVHPKAFDEKEKLQTGDIKVRPDSYVLPHHLWIGVE